MVALGDHLGPGPGGPLVHDPRDGVLLDFDPQALRAVERADNLLSRGQVPAEHVPLPVPMVGQPHGKSAGNTAPTAHYVPSPEPTRPRRRARGAGLAPGAAL